MRKPAHPPLTAIVCAVGALGVTVVLTLVVAAIMTDAETLLDTIGTALVAAAPTSVRYTDAVGLAANAQQLGLSLTALIGGLARDVRRPIRERAARRP